MIPLLIAAGARPGVTANSTDDVELHYAATNSNWTEEVVHKVCSVAMHSSLPWNIGNHLHSSHLNTHRQRPVAGTGAAGAADFTALSHHTKLFVPQDTQ